MPRPLQFDMVFLDHLKPLYTIDLKVLEEEGLVGPVSFGRGSDVVDRVSWRDGGLAFLTPCRRVVYGCRWSFCYRFCYRLQLSVLPSSSSPFSPHSSLVFLSFACYPLPLLLPHLVGCPDLRLALVQPAPLHRSARNPCHPPHPTLHYHPPLPLLQFVTPYPHPSRRGQATLTPVPHSHQGTTLVADNVVKPGNPAYLSWVRSTPAQKRASLASPALKSQPPMTPNPPTEEWETAFRDGPLEETRWAPDEAEGITADGDPDLVYGSEMLDGWDPYTGEKDACEVSVCLRREE